MIDTFVSRHDPGSLLAAHRHRRAYAALVLAGDYTECGPDGVWRCAAGQLVLHPPFHLHGNRMGPSGARVLNFELPVSVDIDHGCLDYGVFRVPDPARLERLARRDPAAALAEAGALRLPQPAAARVTWVEDIAAALARTPALPVAVLARENEVSAAHVSRAFRRRFGIAPSAFRRERRLRFALRLLIADDRDLSAVATECGFADQAHMCRALKKETGLTPGGLRRLYRRWR